MKMAYKQRKGGNFMLGRTLGGRYELLEKIGNGGMAGTR